MHQSSQTPFGQNLEKSKSRTITTTLYELIEAIHEEVGTEEDNSVADIVLQLLETGRIRFLNPEGELSILWPIQ